MTMNDPDDQPEPPIVTRTTEEAETTVRRLATLLQLAGWNAIVISISRAVEVAPGDMRAPGATSTVIDTPEIVPVIVEVLRKQANALEQNSAGRDMPIGFIHDKSNYASGLEEWPK